MKRNLCLLLFCIFLFTEFAQAREKISLNQDWLFLHKDTAGAEAPSFSEKGWARVNLPHDASIYGPFTKQNGGSSRNGFRPLGQGWYRKHILFHKIWAGQRLILEFEGVYRKATVYVNGKACGEAHENGYIDFAYDITDKLHEGDNVIAVHYDNTDRKSSRWYNGEGINRSVWLHVVSPLHVDRYGTFVTTPSVTSAAARVQVETSVRNDSPDSVLCRLVTEIISPQGEVVASAKAAAPFAAGEVYRFRQQLTVNHPQLWQVGHGVMYKVVSRLDSDVYETPFGIRTIEMSPDSGLIVNGRRVYVNGVCLHTDLGPLGTASFDAAWNRRLSVLVDSLGCNGLRLSHNAYPKYVLDWCDRRGILVFDEFFDKWNGSYYGSDAKFGPHLFRDLKTQMRRDRNHPSVFIWSVGNETYEQIRWDWTQKDGLAHLKAMVDTARWMDATRPVTVAQYPNRYYSKTKKNSKDFYSMPPHPFEFYSDVVSTNYLEKFWDKDHQLYPQLVFLESEMAVGELGYDFFNFDHSYPVGQFYWGGTDYIGESFGWPSKGWVRGLVDFTNELKPVGYSVRSFYTHQPSVKLVVIPNKDKTDLVWNDLKMTWNTMEQQWNYNPNQRLKVQVMSNCDETELILNGQSLGRKQLPSGNKAPELTWMVSFEPGELKAVGYRNGKKVAEDVLFTAGKPVRLVATTDTRKLKADGEDLAYLHFQLEDANGHLVPNDDREIEFVVKGEGVNAGMANGNMLCNDPWQGNEHSTYHGKCQLIVRSTTKPGTVVVKAKVKGLKPVTLKLTSSKY
ncbi:MAG: glycoside hydrolase family 2 protein [Prevotella sp.]|jgi:beta-galactosidase